MASNIELQDGRIVIDSEVIASYAGHAALDCFGIVGMATISMKDGLAKLLKSDTVSRGVNVTINEDKDYTCLKVNCINVFVEGVRVID